MNTSNLLSPAPQAIWNLNMETMDRDQLRHLQLRRLQQMVTDCREYIPLYRDRLQRHDILSAGIRIIEDIENIPLTTKRDLQHDMPLHQTVLGGHPLRRIHSTSGTMGEPLLVGYTANDLEVWSELVARVAVAAGLTDRDVMHISFGYALFTGGLGLQAGADRVGATVLPAGTSNPLRQLKLLALTGATILVSTPSYALHLGDVARDNGIDPQGLNIRLGLFGAEPWSEEMRTRIQDVWGLSATDNYGLSEVCGPGVAGECALRQGMHLQEDHFIAEIIDPATTQPLPPNEFGELVLTTLTKQARPLLRYRTGDITCLLNETCSCGRTHSKIHRIIGRTDDMLSVRGINVYPSSIEAALYSVRGIGNEYRIICSMHEYVRRLSIEVEVQPEFLAEPGLSSLKKGVQTALGAKTGLDIPVKIVPPGVIQRQGGKVRRVHYESIGGHD